MNEYRTRLIADVVTGQLDVRETLGISPTPTKDNPARKPTQHPQHANSVVLQRHPVKWSWDPAKNRENLRKAPHKFRGSPPGL